MAAAAKGYRVIGPVAVIRKDGHERYVSHGVTFAADELDEVNAKHLLGVGLIEVAKVEAPAAKSALTQADVDAAVKAAVAAKDAELAQAREAAAAVQAELDAAKADAEKANAPAAAKAPVAPKQS